MSAVDSGFIRGFSAKAKVSIAQLRSGYSLLLMSTQPKLMPREKMLEYGIESLNDVELLAILLRTGTNGTTVLELARRLLTRYSGLRGLVDAGERVLIGEHGIGPVKATQLAAVMELTRRCLMTRLQRGETMSDPQVTRRYLLTQMRHYEREVFACLLLDNQHRLIAFEELFLGTIDGASVYPREVVKCALSANAAAVIFAHNHPSGVAEPSQADRRITDRLVRALSIVDIRVLDHFVVGDTEVVSFAERGLLP